MIGVDESNAAQCGSTRQVNGLQLNSTHYPAESSLNHPCPFTVFTRGALNSLLPSCGPTKQQVKKIFLEVEKPKLLPLPASLFPVFGEAPRTVHQDGYIELQKAYYSVPPEYVGRKVWARWESRLVRIFNLRREQIALHTRAEPGQFATDAAHIHDHKRVLIERGADWLLDRARLIGPHSGTWAEQMFKTRGPQTIRVLHGLLALAEKHPVAQWEGASANEVGGEGRGEVVFCGTAPLPVPRPALRCGAREMNFS